MTDRVFRKDKDAVDAVNNLGFATAVWGNELLIVVQNYSDLNSVNKALVTSTLLGFNYTFAYDQ